MVKYAETGFTRSYYGIGFEASSENKKNSRRSKQNSIESMSRSICEIYGFGQETNGGYQKLPLHKARVRLCIQEIVHEYEQVRNTARTWSPRSDLCWEEQKIYPSWGKRGRSPRLSGAFKLMQRPRVMQKTTAAAELWDWRREEDEEEGHEGEKRNDPSALFIRQKDMCQARESRNRKFRKRSCRLGCCEFIKQGDIMDVFFMTDDVTSAYSNWRGWHHGGSATTRRCWRWRFC